MPAARGPHERIRHGKRRVGSGGGGAVRLVLDWDGTVTERDTLELVIERFGDIATYRRTGVLMGHRLSHDEALARSFATVRAPVDEVVGWVASVARVRPGFRELAQRHRPLIVSSGFHELIDPVLARERVDVEVLANRVDARPNGWRILFRPAARCEHCGERCKRSVLPAGEVAYVGDGYSDRCAALAAARVFATAGLASYLDDRAIPYQAFDDFHDVMRALSEPTAVR
jgi:2-hydroxy-3-keto-5-methylthiopentenyl-1-phosphate phosphatase